MKKILGLGNALVDIMTRISDDSFLDKHNLPKGSMQLVDIEKSNELLKATEGFSKSKSSGGSAANTIHGISNLNAPCGYIGTIGKDDIGAFFEKDMRQNNIETRLFYSNSPSGRVVVCVSPDGERTFATHLGAAIELNADMLTADSFKGYDILHLEGYLVLNNDLVLKAVKLAKENNMQISIDLASYNVVEDNLAFLTNLIDNYVNIVFANEEEAKAFVNNTPKMALEVFAKKVDIAVVKVGKDGSYVAAGSQRYKISPIDANKIDTTGAGDLYASGFLYGLANNFSLVKCGDIGTLLASKVIEVIGSKMTEETWQEIKEKIELM